MDNLQVVKMANIQILLYNTRENTQLQKTVALPSMTFIKKWPSPMWDKKIVTLPPNIVALPPR